MEYYTNAASERCMLVGEQVSSVIHFNCFHRLRATRRPLDQQAAAVPHTAAPPVDGSQTMAAPHPRGDGGES